MYYILYMIIFCIFSKLCIISYYILCIIFKDVNDSGALSTEMGTPEYESCSCHMFPAKMLIKNSESNSESQIYQNPFLFHLSDPQIYARQQSQLQL